MRDLWSVTAARRNKEGGWIVHARAVPKKLPRLTRQETEEGMQHGCLTGPDGTGNHGDGAAVKCQRGAFYTVARRWMKIGQPSYLEHAEGLARRFRASSRGGRFRA